MDKNNFQVISLYSRFSLFTFAGDPEISEELFGALDSAFLFAYAIFMFLR